MTNIDHVCRKCERKLVEQIGLNTQPGNWDGVLGRCEFCKAAHYFQRTMDLELALAQAINSTEDVDLTKRWTDVLMDRGDK